MATKDKVENPLTKEEQKEVAQKTLNRALTKTLQLTKTAKEFNKDGDTETTKSLINAIKKILEGV